MNIISAQFIKGVVGEDSIMYDGTSHLAFIGRSNVGKSSTLNALLERKKLVKTGKTPGKTREINFFKIATDIPSTAYFVDLPGYGYAKLSKKQREELRNLIEWYLTHPTSDMALICLILDAKVGITDIDKEYLNLVRFSKKPYILAFNKLDKINQKEQHKLSKEIEEIGIDKDIPVFYYSASTGKNVYKLREYIFEGKKTA